MLSSKLWHRMEVKIETLTVKDMDITPCLGCMSCWGHTAGKCVILAQ